MSNQSLLVGIAAEFIAILVIGYKPFQYDKFSYLSGDNITKQMYESVLKEAGLGT